MIIFDFILQGHEAIKEKAIETVQLMDFGSMERSEQDKPTHSTYIHSENGLDIYYDYGADYYFFVEGH